jgi:UDP-N-acetylglucosamine--dolichyl-phosphate N-acetylglucosaminephosphotransferase
MLPTFTTNSINILAGINGVEVIQAFIIALSVLLNDMLYLPVWPASFLEFWNIQNPEEGKILDWAAGEVVQRHLMSAYIIGMLPFAVGPQADR